MSDWHDLQYRTSKTMPRGSRWPMHVHDCCRIKPRKVKSKFHPKKEVSAWRCLNIHSHLIQPMKFKSTIQMPRSLATAKNYPKLLHDMSPCYLRTSTIPDKFPRHASHNSQHTLYFPRSDDRKRADKVRASEEVPRDHRWLASGDLKYWQEDETQEEPAAVETNPSGWLTIVFACRNHVLPQFSLLTSVQSKLLEGGSQMIDLIQTRIVILQKIQTRILLWNFSKRENHAWWQLMTDTWFKVAI